MTPPTYPPTPYPYAYPVPVVPIRNGLATTAMVLGLCTFVTFGATGIPAFVCGIFGYRESKKRHGVGHGQAVAGIVLGALPIAGYLGLIVLSIVGRAMR